jgi:hypothetical protein
MYYMGEITEVLYANQPVDGGTSAEFLKSGGLSIEMYQGEAGGPTDVEVAREEARDRVTDTQVGPYEAVVRWADPNADGLRPHLVIWTDEKGRNYALAGLREAPDLVRIARSLVC